MGTCHIFVNTAAFHKCFCQLLTDNTSSRLFMAPPLPQWPCARRTGQPRRVKGPKRHALVLMGTPLSRLQLSLEGTVSIRRPAGWLLPSKPASPYGPVRRAPRTQPSDGLAVGEHPGAQAPALAGEGRVLGGRRGWWAILSTPPPTPGPPPPALGRAVGMHFWGHLGSENCSVWGSHGCLPWKLPGLQERWGPCREMLSNSLNL